MLIFIMIHFSYSVNTALYTAARAINHRQPLDQGSSALVQTVIG